MASTRTQSCTADCPLLQEIALVLEGISEDVLGSSKRFNFLRPCCLAIFIGGIAFDASRLEILLILLSGFQLIRHVLLVLGKRADLVDQALLLVCLHLLFLGPLGFLNVILLHVLIICLLIRSFP